MKTTETTLNKSPLDGWHRAHGATMTEIDGWEMPLHYDAGSADEHSATRKFGGLFDISHMGRFRVAGRGTIDFLQHVLSNNVEALTPWHAEYTLIPNERGGVIDDAYLYRFGEEEEFLLVVNAANARSDWDHLQDEVKQYPGVTLEDQTGQLAAVAFQGPLAARILENLLEDGHMPEPFHNRLSEITLGGAKMLVSRTGYTGEPIGFELFLPADEAEDVWNILADAGGEQGVLPAGLAARDSLRIEAGLPLFGHEFGEDAEGHPMPAFAFPLSGVAVSFSDRKGDFIGREPLQEQFDEARRLRSAHGAQEEQSKILPRRIRPLAVLEPEAVRQGDEVYIGNRKVGVVTSGAVAPYWEFEGQGATMRISDRSETRVVALAYVDVRIRPDHDVEVAAGDRRVKGRIVRWHGRSEAPPYFRPMPADIERREPERAVGKGLHKAEVVLKKALENHRWRQHRCMNFIPSEMTPSPLVRLLQVSDPVGRYAEHKELLAAFGEDVYYYQGTDMIAWVEQRLVAEMASYLGCPQVEARIVSGQMANMAVFSAIVDWLNRTDRRREPRRLRRVINNHLGKGGHLSAQPMGALRDYIAKDPVTEKYAVVNFPICRDNPYRIDVEEAARLIDQHEPELVIFGKSMVLHPEPVAEIRRLVEARKDRPLIMYDMAHVLGLVGPHFQQPFGEGADIVTGSTHKTFFGTQRGVIGCHFPPDTPEHSLWKTIRRRAFPGMLSNHHLGTLLGLLMAAIEMNTFKDDYQRQVIANAKAFARALVEQGVKVEGDPAVDYTETHQVIVNVGYAKGCEVAQHLEENNIIVNYQALPFDESFTSSSGLRIGVSEMTRFGLKEADFEAFAALMAEAVKGKAVGNEVARFRQNFRQMHYCFDGEPVEKYRKQLLRTF